MERWVGKVALVTGASAGIGAALAKTLTEHGMNVVGCARNVGKIEELSSSLQSSKGKLHAVKCDLRNQSEILSMFNHIKQNFGGVDVMINNAGLSYVLPTLTDNYDKIRELLDVNVLALMICTNEAVKQMREKSVDGQIINISSMAGHRLPNDLNSHTYSTTKMMVNGLTEATRRELRAFKTKIRICAVCPGYVETEFLPRMLESSDTSKDAYEKLGVPRLQAEDIVTVIVNILSLPPNVDINDVRVRPVEQVM